MLTAVTDLLRLCLAHACLTRLAGCMAANPLAAGLKGPATPDGDGRSNGALTGTAGGGKAAPPNGTALQPSNGSSGGGTRSLVWPLPGCGSARLLEAGLTHLVLLVAPPSSPEGQQEQQEAPVRVTLSWCSTLPSAAGQQPGAAAGSSDGDSSGGFHVCCRVASEPALPEPVCTALAQQLEAGRDDLFLDSLCLAAHSASAAAAQLTPAAQRAAGLLPGALRLLPAGGPGGSTALRLRGQLQQGERTVVLAVGFHAAGYALLQVQPVTASGAGAAAVAPPAWLDELWQRLEQQVPAFSGAEAATLGGPGVSDSQSLAMQPTPTLRQAWVHRNGLGAALAALLLALAAPA